MGWMFWKKESTDTPKDEKLPRPMDLPNSVGRTLVVDKGLDPDWVWSLRCVVMKKPETKSEFFIRGYEEGAALNKGVRVKDYKSLDDHPELIIFNGSFDKTSHRGDIVLKKEIKPRAA